MNRIKEGYLISRNGSYMSNNLYKVLLTPDIVDCIVFWTKNPIPMLPRLDELKDYMYYFQFTLTGYGRDIEHNAWFSIAIPTDHSPSLNMSDNGPNSDI